MWIVECSADGSSWFEADRRDNNSDMNGKGVTGCFEIPGASREFRCIRLKSTGPDHAGLQHLTLAGAPLSEWLVGPVPEARAWAAGVSARPVRTTRPRAVSRSPANRGRRFNSRRPHP